MAERTKRRVMLKLSGEAFGGGALGVNPDVVAGLAKEIAFIMLKDGHIHFEGGADELERALALLVTQRRIECRPACRM